MAPRYLKIHPILRSSHDGSKVVPRLHAPAIVDGFDFYSLPAVLLFGTYVLKEGHEGCGSSCETVARLREFGNTVKPSTGPVRMALP